MITELYPALVREPLLQCGYRPDLLRSDVVLGNGTTTPLVAFAHAPMDTRSACIAVTDSGSSPREAVSLCRGTGAPIVFVCAGKTLQWWKQSPDSPEYLESVPVKDLSAFFERRKSDFSPDAVYRAKTWGRFKSAYQLSFVDLGLMPLIEEQVGTALEQLIERNVAFLKTKLRLTNISAESGHWLLQTIFWLLSGKILHDKQVGPFSSVDLTDPAEVFRKLGKHYGTNPPLIRTSAQRTALEEAASDISRFGSLALTTTESLGYVYENALISKETRTQLGTHSTPSFLVDYVVGNLNDWIAEIPEDERSVYEPACGHAAFLVSAMRLLTELLPQSRSAPSKRGPYLRSRLHGADIDPFALELARLSLTLTDIPNPDGWDLITSDIFSGAELKQQAKKSTILLANPPFDNFSIQEQKKYRRLGSNLHFVNKAAEMLSRVLPELKAGSVFGVVLPQSFLNNNNAKDARQLLLRDFELREICAFPDKVFSFSDAESVVIIGRKNPARSNSQVRYRRIREQDLDTFRASYRASSDSVVPQGQFLSAKSNSLRVRDLEDVWRYCDFNPKLENTASVGQGLIFHGADLPQGSQTYSQRRFSNSIEGYIRFDQGVLLHGRPTKYWLNLDPDVIRRPMSGTTVKTAQVLLNYAPSSRGPWRLKALLDKAGHPVSSRFITVRPTRSPYSILSLWAILNSPIANAYVFSHLGKRDNVVGDVRQLPMPSSESFEHLHKLANRYLTAANSESDTGQLRDFLLDLDSEVLRLYELPANIERLLLQAFNGWQRVGVPFVQTCYIPPDFKADLSLQDFRALENRDWPEINRERGNLIDKQIDGTITDEEEIRLTLLQKYAEFHVARVAPHPLKELEELENRLLSAEISRSSRN